METRFNGHNYQLTTTLQPEIGRADKGAVRIWTATRNGVSASAKSKPMAMRLCEESIARLEAFKASAQSFTNGGAK